MPIERDSIQGLILGETNRRRNFMMDQTAVAMLAVWATVATVVGATIFFSTRDTGPRQKRPPQNPKDPTSKE